MGHVTTTKTINGLPWPDPKVANGSHIMPAVTKASVT
jgi:hypothetical protein